MDNDRLQKALDERDWRDSNAPQWAKDAAQKEIDVYRLTAALSWPTDPRPSPVPFRWGDYDRLHGEPVPGTYWSDRAEPFDLAAQDGKTGKKWKSWIFRRPGGEWTTDIFCRGLLFESERGARLNMLWDECEACAEKLMRLRARL